MNKALILTDYIIDTIREKSLQLGEGADIWDENQGGVDWIDNELSFVQDLLDIADYDINNIQVDINDYNTVDQVRNYLIEYFSIDDLEILAFFIKEGGTDSQTLRQYRSDNDPEQISELISEAHDEMQFLYGESESESESESD